MSKRVAQKQANRVVREQFAAERRRTRTLWITIGAALVLLIAGIIGWGVYKSQQPETFATPAGVTDVGGGQGGLTVAGGGSVPVEVYLDFLCPHCRDFEASTSDTLNQLAAQNKIHLVWHTLGFLDSSSAPPGYSTRAANAAACASDGGKLAPYGEALFASQPAQGSPGLTDDQLVDLGGPVGLNAPSFAQCVRNGTYEPWVANVNAKAAERNVNSTPTVYVDGKLVSEATPAKIRAAVSAAG